MDTNMMNQELKDFMTSISDMCRNNNMEETHVDGVTNDDSIKMTVFNNSEFGNIDVIMIDGTPYFYATKCAEVLGYKNPHSAITKHCRYAVKYGVPHPQNPDKTLEKTFIPECDLFRLIVTSKLPTAKPFEDWIMKEVIPSIHKDGNGRVTQMPSALDREGQLIVFNHTEFGKIRIVEVDGEPWMVGKDVADALGYSNSRDALSRYVDDEDKGVGKLDTLGGPQEMTIINESGLYSLAFSSKLPTAKKFRRWVTGTVLPTIRKTGGYILGEENMTSNELKNATARVLGAKLNEKIRQEQMDATSFVEFACEGKPVSWNPAQLMKCLLWRYAGACCGNNIKEARYALYANLNEYCGICLWKRRQDAAKADCRMVSFPMYAFLSIEEQQLALLVIAAMCVYSGANINDLLYKYCSPVLMSSTARRIAG